MRLSEQLREAIEPSVFDMPGREELVSMWMSYKRHGTPYSRELATKMADQALKSAQNPKYIEKAKKAIKEAQKEYQRELKAGQKYANILSRVAPDPKRDVKPFQNVFSKAKSPEEAEMIATGRKIPFAWWKPFAPIEIVVYTDEKDRATGKQLVSIEDGNHRLKAAKQAGVKHIRAKITWRGGDGRSSKQVTVILPIR